MVDKPDLKVLKFESEFTVIHDNSMTRVTGFKCINISTFVLEPVFIVHLPLQLDAGLLCSESCIHGL